MAFWGVSGCSQGYCANGEERRRGRREEEGGGGEQDLLVYPLMSTGSGLRRGACRWTRPLSGGRRGIIFVVLWEFTGFCV